MPSSGKPRIRAIPLAAFIPTTNDPGKPGPLVTAMAVMLSQVTLASSIACLITDPITSTCAREAISGNTPPYC